VIAVDDDPRTVGPAERCNLVDAIEDASAAEQDLADEDEVVPADCASSRNLAEKVSNGSTGMRSTWAAPASSHLANCRRAL